MEENLVIVESPAKAKTIEKFLGDNFLVKSSFGHIRDLSKKKIGIDLENNYQPIYEISPDKKNVVAELKKLAKTAKTVWLASDEDREGEAIAWHLFEVLGLDEKRTKRIVFHEITKNAILKAIENPRTINSDLVNAQQARRVLDRLVGFEISPILWKKVKPALSAGRVQSVAVRLLVEREREVHKFESKNSYKVSGLFDIKNPNGAISKLKAERSEHIDTESDAIKFLNSCKGSKFEIINIEKKPAKKSPSAPFTTSTLQQEANRKLGFSVSQTMATAQRLYEAGHITYMRTDSVNLSELAIKEAKKAILNFCKDERYIKERRYKTKAKGAQEAHEAIRPTYLSKATVNASAQEQKLYELIWKRTIASQMSDAELERTLVTINISSNKEKLTATGEVIKFDGFLKVYMETPDEEKSSEEKSLLPPLSVGQELELNHLLARERFTKHAPRYNEASLVKKLEELGIGRPSTYAPTISTIQNRGYVVKETREGKERKRNFIYLKEEKIVKDTNIEMAGAEKSKLFPTDIGMVVNDFLVKYFTKVLNYNFTAAVEKEFDEIATGEQEWREMIDKFYKPFHKNVEETEINSERNNGERKLGTDKETGKEVSVRIGRFGPMVQLGEANLEDEKEKPTFASIPSELRIENITLEQAINLLKQSNEGRFLGEYPETGQPIFAKIGRFGPMVQLGENDKEEKPRFASIKGQTVETITLADALELFKLPRSVGEYEESEMVVADGRFGPFIKHKAKFYSLKKGVDDPLTITVERSIQLIEEKREKDRKNTIKLFEEDEDLKLILDRWGKPCIHFKKKYLRIPEKIEPKELSYKQCMEMIKDDPKMSALIKPAKKTKAKKTTAKKTTTKKKETKTKKK